MTPPMPYIPYLSFTRWSQEAIYLTEVKHYQSFYNIQSGLDLIGYHLEDLHKCIAMIFVIAFVMRVGAFLSLQFLNRDKRK